MNIYIRGINDKCVDSEPYPTIHLNMTRLNFNLEMGHDRNMRCWHFMNDWAMIDSSITAQYISDISRTIWKSVSFEVFISWETYPLHVYSERGLFTHKRVSGVNYRLKHFDLCLFSSWRKQYLLLNNFNWTFQYFERQYDYEVIIGMCLCGSCQCT